MSKYIPLSYLKDTSGIVNYCKECKVPVYVTRNGTSEMVIMDVDFFDNYLSPYIIDGEIDVAKVLEYMPLFINIKALKNTGELSKRCAETKNAIHIIKSGVGELVIMSLEVYNRCKRDALNAMQK